VPPPELSATTRLWMVVLRAYPIMAAAMVAWKVAQAALGG